MRAYRTIQVQVNAMTYHMNVEVVTGDRHPNTKFITGIYATQPLSFCQDKHFTSKFVPHLLKYSGYLLGMLKLHVVHAGHKVLPKRNTLKQPRPLV